MVQRQTIWLNAAHITGMSNVLADQQSRILHNDRTEWILQNDISVKILDLLGKCYLDLFTFRSNNQLPICVSWHHDPWASFIDAFSLSWTDKICYDFSPLI